MLSVDRVPETRVAPARSRATRATVSEAPRPEYEPRNHGVGRDGHPTSIEHPGTGVFLDRWRWPDRLAVLFW